MSATLQLDVPAELLESASMTLDDVRSELAVLFYQSGRISLGRAAAFAGLGVGQFLTVLAEHHISPHEGVDEALQDAATLANLRRSK